MIVREAADEYVASLKRQKPLTVEGYRQRLDVFCSWCESQQPPIGLELEQIRSKHIDTFVLYLKSSRVSHKTNKQHISTYTLAGYVRVILSFLRWCLEDEEYQEFVKTVVVSRIKKPKIEQTVIETFTKEQLDALFAVCSREYNGHLQARDRAILALLIDTGIRASELCDLTISNCHLDPKDCYILVHGKGDKWREVGLGDRSRRELKTYLRRYRLNASRDEKVFLSRKNHAEPFSSGGLLQLVYRLGRWAHIEGVRCSPHTFRHTFACQYLLNGGDIFALQKLLGHTDISTTQGYLKAITAKQARQSLQGKSVLDSLS